MQSLNDVELWPDEARVYPVQIEPGKGVVHEHLSPDELPPQRHETRARNVAAGHPAQDAAALGPREAQPVDDGLGVPHHDLSAAEHGNGGRALREALQIKRAEGALVERQGPEHHSAVEARHVRDRRKGRHRQRLLNVSPAHGAVSIEKGV